MRPAVRPHIEGSAWVRRLHPVEPLPEPRLICFPHAGGAASWYTPLARALAGSVDVVALQYPGRQERLAEPCVESIESLTALIAAELEDGWLDGSFALFGHSMGAIVAYEVARIIEPEPLGSFVSGRRAPSTWRDEHVHKGGDPSLLREVARLAGTPGQLLDDQDVHEMLLPALRGDYKAIETYVWPPGPPLRCPIWAFVGDADPLTTDSEAAAWSRHTTGPFDLRVFPGGHFYAADHLPELVTLISERLTPAGCRGLGSRP